MPGKMPKFMKLIGLVVMSIAVLTAQASDFAKEKRWADQVADSILDGEAIWLEADDHQFFSIYTEAEDGNADNSLIIMHGTGVHPNWDQVIRPLRVDLTSQGWNTLSIQMPVLANEAEHDDYAELFPEVGARINAALQYLQSQESGNVVLVGHSLGSLMTSYYLSQNQSDLVQAFIAIGMSGGAKHQAMDSLHSLKKIQLPVLDLFGSNDLPQVLETRHARLVAAQQGGGNQSYQQLQVADANHFFDNKNDALVEAVTNWLEAFKQ